ncbi:ankyrin repeat domain-containing protein [Paracoccaceae bacterium]|nr:ankyrin repeat domain-containing protein [Paracoccaceae bacterium]
MRAAIIALLLTFGSQAGAECGNLCDKDWWKTSTAVGVQAELDGGADVTARTEYGSTPLHYAARDGTPANIQVLLAAGADVMARNEFGLTPLHWVALAGTPANIQSLLDAGADLMARDSSGETPLHRAAQCFLCKAGVIQILLIAGADAKAKNKNGKTPWDFAQNNKFLKGTKGYWALNDAQYN